MVSSALELDHLSLQREEVVEEGGKQEGGKEEGERGEGREGGGRGGGREGGGRQWHKIHQTSSHTFLFLSPPSSKCLHLFRQTCFLLWHLEHSILRTTFFVVLACTQPVRERRYRSPEVQLEANDIL